MKVVPFIVSLVITIALIVCLDRQWGTVPPVGKFVSPQHGFWQNAEAVDENFNSTLVFPQLHDKSTVYFDQRLVPHVFAENETDAYFIQGYLHAKFRLWQMEFQVMASAGRLSEIVGDKTINYDRRKRRLGMGYAAEKALIEMESDSTTKAECDAYTEGVNAYISNMKESELPIEYKLLNYKPEKWSNLKTALFLKYMSLELAGGENDFEYTNAKNVFGLADFELLYPSSQDSVDPIIPKGYVYPKPGVNIKAPSTVDSLYFAKTDSADIAPVKPDPANGSNNWAVGGKKTKSGKPILCNDPHLGLNLPSIWFEMQLSTPSMNVYGATFPGAPGVIIGFNDSCAFGVTNAERDVADFYEMKFKDETMKEYWFNGEWKTSDFRYDTIKVKDKPDVVDTIAYTVFGPVMYDRKFSENAVLKNKYYALRWKAHDPSNELKCFNGLDHAKNYYDYLSAIKNMHTPGQNFVFASKSGDIAIWDQGEFPAKWKHQGDFIMPGTDSSYMWQAMIPQDENPHIMNPERGFVSSANQFPADPAAYPYYLGGNYPPYRGLIINRFLNQMNGVTTEDMMKLQTENYNVFAEMARPILIKYMSDSLLTEDEQRYFDTLKTWNLRNDVNEKGATIFVVAWDYLVKAIYSDELTKTKLPMVYPYESTLLEALLKDSNYKFVDNITTDKKETLRDDVTAAFKTAVITLRKADADGKLKWGKYKDTRVSHLVPTLTPFSRQHLPIGGGTNCINAEKDTHGPSWRMIVELTDSTNAYGVYPGGQSGNPGSPYYDSFIDTWAAGKYFPLWIMGRGDVEDKRIKAKIEFSK